MIPQTFPSTQDAVTGVREMVTFPLVSVAGLTRWIDYIPVKTVATSASKQGTTDIGGYQPVSPLGSISGLMAFKDYVPTYEDAAATVAWECSAVGYIPVAASV